MMNGEVVFADWYRYTWILSSLNFGVTVLTGTFAGYILKDKEWMPKRKLTYLLAIGAAMVAIGWIWGIWHPVNQETMDQFDDFGKQRILLPAHGLVLLSH